MINYIIRISNHLLDSLPLSLSAEVELYAPKDHFSSIPIQCKVTYELGGHRTALIAQWRIVLHNPLSNQIIQRKQVLALASPVKISPTERKRSKVFVNGF